MMQTVSGVTDDGQEVVAVVVPGKYPQGSSVLVEARHIVGKPKGLDWDRAAMLPFLVRMARCRLAFRTQSTTALRDCARRYHKLDRWCLAWRFVHLWPGRKPTAFRWVTYEPILKSEN